jgi:hypothetical protein
MAKGARNAKGKKSSKKKPGKSFTLNVVWQMASALFLQAPETKR